MEFVPYISVIWIQVCYYPASFNDQLYEKLLVISHSITYLKLWEEKGKRDFVLIFLWILQTHYNITPDVISIQYLLIQCDTFISKTNLCPNKLTCNMQQTSSESYPNGAIAFPFF